MTRFGGIKSDRSDHYIFPFYKNLQEGRVELFEVITQLFKILGNCGLCYFGWLLLKLIVAILICKHPELTNEKVKYITHMIVKDKHHSN